jgi:GT2 family glycosyltransferase
MFQTKVVDRTQTHILCSKSFSGNCVVYLRDNVENIAQPDRP